MILNGQPLVGIIANPASGKDIRRLVAHATTVDNQEKVSIIQRALVGLGAAGVTQVLVMPDSYHLGERALRDLRGSGPLPEVGILEMPVADAAIDRSGGAPAGGGRAGCILVLGGDGTVRVASKGCGEVPLLPISTGTNNVLPTFVEGTVAGLAAGAVAAGWWPWTRGATATSGSKCGWRANPATAPWWMRRCCTAVFLAPGRCGRATISARWW